MAVHARPAAFDGVDGFSYSVDILAEQTGVAEAPWGAYLFFVKWSAGEPQVSGHLETDFLVTGSNEGIVRRQVGAMPLASVKATLDGLIRRRPATASREGDRRWWEAAARESDEQSDADPAT